MNKYTFKRYVRENGIDDKSRNFFKKEFLDGMEIKKEDLDYIINLHLKMKNPDYLKTIKKIGSGFNKEQYEKYLEFRKKHKHDNGSDEFYKALYGKKWKERKKYVTNLTKTSLKNFIRKYGEEEGKKKWKNLKIKASENAKHQKENFIKKHGKEKGEEMWKERNKKIAQKHTKKYIYEHYDNPKEEIKKRYPNDSLKGFIERYGAEKGKQKYNEWCKKLSKANSLEGYIKKYGEEDGPKKWNEFIKKQSFNNSLKGYIKKYGEEEGKKRYKNKINKCTKNSKVSKKSIKFFNKLNTFLKDDLIYGEGKELRLSDGEHNYFYDATYQNKYVIEFHGDIFHGNPEKFGPDDHCFPYDKTITAKQLWEYDAKKKKVAEDQGYTYIYFWEDEKPENAYNKLKKMGIR